MNIAPSDLPSSLCASNVAKPGFDIILAVVQLRQSMSPTVRLLRGQARGAAHLGRVNALCHYLARPDAIDSCDTPPLTRFFDLADSDNGLAETVNDAFTRGFQPMLSPSRIDQPLSALPSPHDDNME